MPNIATPRNNETVMQDVTSPSLSVFLRCEPEAHNKWYNSISSHNDYFSILSFATI